MAMVSECKEKTICQSKVQQRMGKPMDKLPAPDPFSSSGLVRQTENLKVQGCLCPLRKGKRTLFGPEGHFIGKTWPKSVDFLVE